MKSSVASGSLVVSLANPTTISFMRMIILLVFATALFAYEFDYELDAYYSSVGYSIGFEKDAIKDEGEKPELEIYKDLLMSLYRPTAITLEASVNPMPIAGVLYKRHARNSYDDFDVNGGLNLIQAVTEGFEDPYAISFFVGNVVRFEENGVKESKNRGFAGFLFSFGDKYIYDNELIKDNWHEIELKIKGDRDFKEHSLNWSFRVGGKFHSNKMIADTWYLGIRRNFVDFIDTSSWINNSSVEYRADFSQEDFEALKHYFLIQKNFPHKETTTVFSLGAGFVWNSYKLHSDEIGEKADKDRFSFMIRPNLKF